MYAGERAGVRNERPICDDATVIVKNKGEFVDNNEEEYVMAGRRTCAEGRVGFYI